MMQLNGMQIMNDLIYERVGRNHAILDDSMGEMVDVSIRHHKVCESCIM